MGTAIIEIRFDPAQMPLTGAYGLAGFLQDKLLDFLPTWCCPDVTVVQDGRQPKSAEDLADEIWRRLVAERSIARGLTGRSWQDAEIQNRSSARIQAIKDLRQRSTELEGVPAHMGLVEAKDLIDAAVQRWEDGR
jgi:hypothetical protein